MSKQDFESKDSQETALGSLQQSSRLEGAIHEDVILDTHIDSPRLAWCRARALCRDAFSEFLGTMILVLFGDGVVAQVILSRGEKGNYQSICWGWG